MPQFDFILKVALPAFRGEPPLAGWRRTLERWRHCYLNRLPSLNLRRCNYNRSLEKVAYHEDQRKHFGQPSNEALLGGLYI